MSRHPWLDGLVLITLAIAVGLPSVSGPFLANDIEDIAESRILHEAGGLGRIWFEWGATPRYRPLVYSTYWLQVRLGAESAADFHTVNLALHALASWLVWRLLVRLGVPGAWFAAALFAVHPIHIQAVAWISGRGVLLSSVFYLAAACAYLRATVVDQVPQKTVRHWRTYITAEFFFVAALLSDPGTATLPFALLLAIWYLRGSSEWLDWLYMLPMFAWGLALYLLNIYCDLVVLLVGQSWDISAGDRMVIAGRGLWFYLAQLALPFRSSFRYERWVVDSGSFWQLMIPVVAVSVLVALFLSRSRIGRGAYTAMAFFVLTLLPYLGLVDLPFMRFAFVADSLAYLASLGPLALFAAAAKRWFDRDELTWSIWKRPAAALLILMLLSLGLWRSSHYRSQTRLWQAAIEAAPNSWSAHNEWGRLLMAEDKLDEARRSFLAAAKLNVRAAEPILNLGHLAHRRNDLRQAGKHFAEACIIEPTNAEANLQVGRIKAHLGELDQAIEFFKFAAALDPHHAPTHAALGQALSELDPPRYDEASQHLDLALALDPLLTDALLVQGRILAKSGHADEAEARYRRVLEIDPRNGLAYRNLSKLSLEQGRPQEAVRQLVEATKRMPRSVHLAVDLADLLATHPDDNVRDIKEAQKWAEHSFWLLDADPRSQDAARLAPPDVVRTMASVFAELGAFEQAVAFAELALEAAKQAEQKDLIDDIGKRLDQFKQNKPYRREAQSP